MYKCIKEIINDKKLENFLKKKNIEKNIIDLNSYNFTEFLINSEIKNNIKYQDNIYKNDLINNIIPIKNSKSSFFSQTMNNIYNLITNKKVKENENIYLDDIFPFLRKFSNSMDIQQITIQISPIKFVNNYENSSYKNLLKKQIKNNIKFKNKNKNLIVNNNINTNNNNNFNNNDNDNNNDFYYSSNKNSSIFNSNKSSIMSNQNNYSYKALKITKLKNISNRLRAYNNYINNNINNIDNNNNNIITCINVYNSSILFIGLKNGLVRSFDLENNYDLKKYSSSEVEKIKDIEKDVFCISFYASLNKANNNKIVYVIIGYAIGFINIFEMESNLLIKKLLNFHEMPILSCKLIEMEEKNCLVYSSDLIGKVRLINIRKGLFKNTEEAIVISNCNTPCFNIDMIKVYNSNNKNLMYVGFYSNIEFIEIFYVFYMNKNYKIQTCKIINNPEKIEFELLNDENNNNNIINNNENIITKNNNNDNNNENNDEEKINLDLIPDVDFGKGFIPGNENKLYNLIIVSWLNKITLFYYNSNNNNNNTDNLIECGNYITSNSIQRCGFLCDSIIYYIDNEKSISIIHTLNFNKTNENNNNDFNHKNSYSISQNETELINEEILSISKDFIEGGLIYNNTIIKSPIKISSNSNILSQNSSNIYLITINNEIISIELANFKCILDDYEKMRSWNELFYLFSDILKGKNISLSGIPLNLNEKKKLLLDENYVKNYYLKNYLNSIFENDEIKINNEENEIIIENCIEFSIEIGDLKYFYNEIKRIENENNKNYIKNIFIEKLIKYIIKRKIKQINNKEIIDDLINYYYKNNNNNEIYYLSKFIIYLDVNSLILNENVLKICEKNNFFSALIYIYTNGKNDYISPFEKIFKFFVNNAKEIETLKKENENNKNKNKKFSIDQSKVNFYTNDLVNQISDEKFELSKEFLGHKLIWFCYLLINKKTFPNNTNISNESFKKNIPLLFKKLLNFEVIIKFISFDSFFYFDLLANFLTNEESFNVINNNINNNDYKLIINEYKNINIKNEENNNFNNILNCIWEFCNKTINYFAIFDYSIFLLKIMSFFYKNNNIEKINKDLILKALNIILNFNINNKNNNFEDKFKNHFKLINNDNDYLNEISELINNIIIIIININKKNNNFSYDFLDELIKNCLNSNFLNSKIFLLTLKENYNKCIEVYLSEKKYENKIKIFDFIEKTMEKLIKEIKNIQNIISTSIKNDNQKNIQLKNKRILFKSFENKILSTFYKLADISLDNIILLANKFFPNEDEKIINCLEKIPLVQLKYISIKLKSLLLLSDNFNINNNQKIWNIIFLYVKLLIKLEKKNEIKKFLEEHLNYFNDDEKKIQNLLEICLKCYDVDSIIFLYKIKGDNKNAVEIIITEIKTNYNNIIKNIFKNVFNYNLNNIYIQNIKNLVEIGIKICQNKNNNFNNNNNNNNNFDNEELWLEILSELYLILNDSKNLLEKENNINLDNFIDSYTFIIQNYLKNMCFYVSINKILDTVTNNNNVAEFKEFKKLLLDMLFLFKNLGTILNDVKILYNNKIILNKKKFVDEKENGIFVDKNKCDFCSKDFEKDKKIFVFGCKHVFHDYCCFNNKNNVYECLICKIKEINLFGEENSNNFDNNNNNENNNNNINNINIEDDDDEEKETEEMKEIRIKKQKEREINLKKMKIFDKKFYNDEF